MSTWICLVLFCVAAAPLTRAELVRAVLDAHPEARVAAIARDAAALDAAAPSVVPPLMVGLSAAPVSLGQHAPGVAVDLAWELPTGGMRRASTAVASAAVEGASAEVAMRRLALAARTSVALDAVRRSDAALAVLTHHRDALVEAAQAVERRVAAGLVGPDGGPMARMAVLEAEERLVAARARRVVARAELGSLLVGTGIDLERALSAVDLGGSGPSSVGGGEVAMAAADLAMAEGDVRMAVADGRPMIELMSGYSTMWADVGHRWMVGVGVEVPLDGATRKARVDAAAARARAAAAQLTNEERRRDLAVATARAMVEEAAAMAHLMEHEMAPLAAERARLARTAWEAGRGAYADWLAAENDRVHVALRVADAALDRARAEAMLAMAEGRLAGVDGGSR